jgi:cobalamin biosynthesis protein CobD/CbiB
MRKTTFQGFAAGLWITIFLVLAVVLVSWDSSLVLPLAAGFVVIGYLSTIGLALSNRASVRKIIERSRQERLAVLRHRIDAFKPRMADLSPQQSEHLRDLLSFTTRSGTPPPHPLTPAP